MEKLVITLDNAIDMLPVIGEIYDKLDIKQYAAGIKKENNSEDEVQKMGMEFIFSHVFKKARDVKQELLELAAIVYDTTPEEAAKMTWTKVIAVVMAIKNDEELNSFFSDAMH